MEEYLHVCSVSQPMTNAMQHNSITDTPVNKVGLVGFIISVVSILGLGLISLVGLVVSLVGLRRHPRGFAIAVVCISVLSGVLWVFAWVIVYQAVLTGIEMSKKPMQVKAWEYVEWVC